MVEYNGIKVMKVDQSGILISTPVNEFIFSAMELEWIYKTDTVRELINSRI